jgi:hypothetical protein
MSTFTHPLWGYAFTYPDDWHHRSIVDANEGPADVFAATPEALQPDYAGPRAGQVAVRAEWNPTRVAVDQIWERRIGLLASLMSARKVGAAPWTLRDCAGVEAEIVLPKRENQRLWTGILARGFHVLHFMATHPLEERAWFEPLATALIASLRFPERTEGLALGVEGLPLPPGYAPVDARRLVDQIDTAEHWQGYSGEGPIDALQAFYVREAPNHGWEILEYRPFPQNPELGFARFQLARVTGNGAGRTQLTLGLLPRGQGTVLPHSPADLVVRQHPMI